jgi:hypothetical protein
MFWLPNVEPRIQSQLTLCEIHGAENEIRFGGGGGAGISGRNSIAYRQIFIGEKNTCILHLLCARRCVSVTL